MPFYVYILRCADNSYYTGHTDDLDKRYTQHATGAIRGYTYERRPVELVWADEIGTREEALTAELKIKGWSRAKKEAWIAKDWKRLSKFAMPPSERQARLLAKKASSTLGVVPRLRSGGTGDYKPVIVLVRPQLGENIGKAARAMLNFGLTELRLVAPRDGWPNPDAGPAAAGADAVLANAQVFGNVSAAVADCAHVFATTVRKRGVLKPVVDAAEAATAIHAEPGRSAILFGPERAGLETDDVAIARTILTVPINPEFGSLNLAQAVILVAYEWSKKQSLAQPTKTEAEPPAPQSELDGLFDHLDGMLEKSGFYFPPDKVPTVKRAIRGILTKPAWTTHEVRTLRGVLTMLEKPKPKG